MVTEHLAKYPSQINVHSMNLYDAAGFAACESSPKMKYLAIFGLKSSIIDDFNQHLQK